MRRRAAPPAPATLHEAGIRWYPGAARGTSVSAIHWVHRKPHESENSGNQSVLDDVCQLPTSRNHRPRAVTTNAADAC
jgi:hypothetical protein